MTTKTTIIDHPSKLNYLTKYRPLKRKWLGKLVLAEIFKHPERERLEKELNHYYYSCGCSTGAKSLIVGVVFGAIYSRFGIDEQSVSIASSVLYALGFGLGGALLGKLLGQILDNQKLKGAVHTIQSDWPKDPDEEFHNIVCG